MMPNKWNQFVLCSQHPLFSFEPNMPIGNRYDKWLAKIGNKCRIVGALIIGCRIIITAFFNSKFFLQQAFLNFLFNFTTCNFINYFGLIIRCIKCGGVFHPLSPQRIGNPNNHIILLFLASLLGFPEKLHIHNDEIKQKFPRPRDAIKFFHPIKAHQFFNHFLTSYQPVHSIPLLVHICIAFKTGRCFFFIECLPARIVLVSRPGRLVVLVRPIAPRGPAGPEAAGEHFEVRAGLQRSMFFAFTYIFSLIAPTNPDRHHTSSFPGLDSLRPDIAYKMIPLGCTQQITIRNFAYVRFTVFSHVIAFKAPVVNFTNKV